MELQAGPHLKRLASHDLGEAISLSGNNLHFRLLPAILNN